MDLVYIKLFVDYLDAIEPLGDAERGRLFTALLEYARTGEAPQLGGNERFIFPMMRAQLDRDNADLEEKSRKRSESGKQGGRPKKANETEEKQKKQMLFDESKKSKDKDKEEDNRQKTIDKEESIHARTRFAPPSVDEVAEYCLERKNGIDAQRFVDFYASKGWRVGNQQMKDWKACVRTWEQRDKKPSDSGTDRNAWMDEFM